MEAVFLTFCFPKSFSPSCPGKRLIAKNHILWYKQDSRSTLLPNSHKTHRWLPPLCVTRPDTDPENSHPLSHKWLTELFIPPKLAWLRDQLFLPIWLTEPPSDYKNNPRCKIIQSIACPLLPIKFKAKPPCWNTLISNLGALPIATLWVTSVPYLFWVLPLTVKIRLQAEETCAKALRYNKTRYGQETSSLRWWEYRAQLEDYGGVVRRA